MTIIAVDFDGTCVEHRYPEVGADVPVAVKVLKELADVGHQLILYTMRDKAELTAAVEWFKKHDIPLYGVNTNPTQLQWTSSPKAYARVYIDDAALGCPIIYDSEKYGVRPIVDWIEVRKWLVYNGCLPEEE